MFFIYGFHIPHPCPPLSCQGPKWTNVCLGLTYVFFYYFKCFFFHLLITFAYSFHLAPPPPPPKDASHNASTSYLSPPTFTVHHHNMTTRTTAMTTIMTACMTRWQPPPLPCQRPKWMHQCSFGPNICVFFFTKRGKGPNDAALFGPRYIFLFFIWMFTDELFFHIPAHPPPIFAISTRAQMNMYVFFSFFNCFLFIF